MSTTAAASSKAVVSQPRKLPHHHLILLITELVFILGYPFASGNAVRPEMFHLFALLVFCGAIYALVGSRRATVIALGLGVPAILIHLANLAGHLLAVEQFAQMSELAFLVFVTGLCVYSVLSDASVTADTLAGAVSAYLLVGITYGLAYVLTERFLPGSFRNTVEPARHLSPADPAEFIFFSFVTLTTVGYGDIVPWTAHAKSIVILESVTGIMYPAVLIGRLIGLHGRKPEPS